MPLKARRPRLDMLNRPMTRLRSRAEHPVAPASVPWSRIGCSNQGRQRFTQVISFMNMKGGVGKTTLAVNVAYALAYQHGKKVLMVDGDARSRATDLGRTRLEIRGMPRLSWLPRSAATAAPAQR
jgi:Flp pilus assembly CpaE family ATPase